MLKSIIDNIPKICNYTDKIAKSTIEMNKNIGGDDTVDGNIENLTTSVELAKSRKLGYAKSTRTDFLNFKTKKAFTHL